MQKRAPALLDNLVQAFLMAPFFVLLEASPGDSHPMIPILTPFISRNKNDTAFSVVLQVLQTVFKYEPYPGFHARVTQRIEAEIKDWQEKKQKKMS